MRHEERTQIILITHIGPGRGDGSFFRFFRFVPCDPEADYPTPYENGTVKAIPRRKKKGPAEKGTGRDGSTEQLLRVPLVNFRIFELAVFRPRRRLRQKRHGRFPHEKCQ